MNKIPDIIIEISRRLRKNMTVSEMILWSFLRSKKLWIKFLRQKPIYVYTDNSWLDRYIISDFFCYEKKLILEIDWNIHNLKEVYILDCHKKILLEKHWYKLIRIQNKDIKNNINLVIKKIKKYL